MKIAIVFMAGVLSGALLLLLGALMSAAAQADEIAEKYRGERRR